MVTTMMLIAGVVGLGLRMVRLLEALTEASVTARPPLWQPDRRD